MQTQLKTLHQTRLSLTPLQSDRLKVEVDEGADMAACRAALKEGSYTFFAASLLLPRAVREPASALYAFCRLADDAVDQESGGTACRYAAVSRLRDRLDAAYAGRSQQVAADRALAAVLARFEIPRALPEALLEGFEWDAVGRRYETIDDLYAYAARVAATVGAMMAMLMGVRSTDGLARACDLGVAMQLSNIARDVGEDARLGRIYLPLTWLREEGIDPELWLKKPEFNSSIGAVVKRLLQAADALYQRVDDGVALLPLSCQPGINAARFLYAEIGHQVERQGLDSVSRRAVVPRPRKAWLLAKALTCGRMTSGGNTVPPLPANCFLVDAVSAADVTTEGSSPSPSTGWWRLSRRLDDRVVWVINLFERLERAEHVSADTRGSIENLAPGS